MRKNIKLPPCPICRTRKFRKNATGNYVCKYGHQLAVGDIADCIVDIDKLLNITIELSRRGSRRGNINKQFARNQAKENKNCKGETKYADNSFRTTFYVGKLTYFGQCYLVLDPGLSIIKCSSNACENWCVS